MQKFFIQENQINENKIKLVGEDVKHITQVLRAKKGEKMLICNKENGQSYLTTIEHIDADFVLCNIESKIETSTESKIEVSIFQGLPKADKMEYIIQKNTEIGVKKIIPVIMKRCIVKWDEKVAVKKIERWQKIIQSAAEQSKRDYIPKIEYPITIKELCQKISEFDLVLLAYEEEQKNTLKAELKKIKLADGIKIGMIIGPEGGIDKEEVNLLKEAGAKVITLGKRILRTETASIVIMSNIIYEYEV